MSVSRIVTSKRRERRWVHSAPPPDQHHLHRGRRATIRRDNRKHGQATTNDCRGRHCPCSAQYQRTDQGWADPDIRLLHRAGSHGSRQRARLRMADSRCDSAAYRVRCCLRSAGTIRACITWRGSNGYWRPVPSFYPAVSTVRYQLKLQRNATVETSIRIGSSISPCGTTAGNA
jgi:hypothetical protein